MNLDILQRPRIMSFKKHLEKIRSHYTTLYNENGQFKEFNSCLPLFLDELKSLPISRSEILITLACDLNEKLGWKRLRPIFESIIKEEDEEENDGTYAIWIHLLEFWFRNDELRKSERISIWNESKKIHDSALSNSENHCGIALSMGLLFLHHPDIESSPQKHLKKALQWFDNALKWSQENGDLEVKELASRRAADCLYELGNRADAMKLYKKLNLKEIEITEGKKTAERIRKRLTCSR